MTDLEQAIRDDLIAAGIDPEKYLGQPRLKKKGSNPDQSFYFCDECSSEKGGWYHFNLRYINGRWRCVNCAGLREERLTLWDWQQLQEEKSANG